MATRLTVIKPLSGMHLAWLAGWLGALLVMFQSRVEGQTTEARTELASGAEAGEPLRIAMIGLDTSHSTAFARLLNDPQVAGHIPGCRVVKAYPFGSRSIPSSYERIEGYTEQVLQLGVEVVASLDEALDGVDAVLLETNDGQLHLEQAAVIFGYGKPVFIDKPLAADLADCLAIARLAEHHRVPFFTASSLRFSSSPQALRGGQIGAITGCDTYSPAAIEASHSDLFWYGIHGCELLMTIMGPGCTAVTRAHTEDFDVVTAVWDDGRIGTFRGLRSGATGFGGTAFGTNKIATIGPYEGYAPLLLAVVEFFRSGQPPVEWRETLELYSLMDAARLSRERGGASVTLQEAIRLAEPVAEQRLLPWLSSP
jgi:hypothetical protein